jgi:predicted RNA-binding Zn-ribbon protein involved in translation (DUF1610 family)
MRFLHRLWKHNEYNMARLPYPTCWREEQLPYGIVQNYVTYRCPDCGEEKEFTSFTVCERES